jgi:hypothetical protein
VELSGEKVRRQDFEREILHRCQIGRGEKLYYGILIWELNDI